MAGRGRGRKITFSMETVCVPRGENVPVCVQQPTPLFPIMEQKPLPLLAGEELEYLLALKQELRGAMKTLPCFIQPASTHRDVERYSDKYHSGEHTDTSAHWSMDWKRLPKELRSSLKRRPRDCEHFYPPRAPSPQKKKKLVKEKEEVLLKLETLEKKEEERGNSGGEEQEEEEETEEKKKQENEEAEGEEEYDEEEFEEETDYIMSYFDNGEEFGGDSDDNMDEAVY